MFISRASKITLSADDIMTAVECWLNSQVFMSPVEVTYMVKDEDDYAVGIQPLDVDADEEEND